MIFGNLKFCTLQGKAAIAIVVEIAHEVNKVVLTNPASMSVGTDTLRDDLMEFAVATALMSTNNVYNLSREEMDKRVSVSIAIDNDNAVKSVVIAGRDIHMGYDETIDEFEISFTDEEVGTFPASTYVEDKAETSMNYDVPEVCKTAIFRVAANYIPA